MKKIIQEKYSDKRRKEFAIKTEVIKLPFNIYKVRKYNLFPEGEAHIKGMERAMNALKEEYLDSKFYVQDGKLIKNGMEFSYIKGETLQSVLSGYIKRGEREELEKALKDYFDVFNFDKNITPFVMTKEFKEIFGERGEELKDYPAKTFSDIDLIPSNIIVNKRKNKDKKYTIIDYEWSFDFPIPLKYIMFRAMLFFHDENKGESLLSWGELLNLIFVSTDEEMLFRRIEDHFQEWIVD